MIMPVVPLARYSSDKETFMLEDDSGRIKLTGPVLASRILVTGIVVAVLGTQKIGGEIEVEEFALPDVPPQRSLKGIAAFLVSLPPPTAPLISCHLLPHYQHPERTSMWRWPLA